MKEFLANLSNVIDINPETKPVLIIWSVSLVIFLIILGILARRINRSIDAASQNNGRINQYLAAVPADKIGTVQAVYQNTQKHLGAAMILAVVGGTFGLHRIYLGRKRSAGAMFFLFWTGVPTIISLFDLSDMPRTVSEFNLHVAESLYNQLAAPKIE